MNLIIAGATGFIGSALCDRLLQQGHSLTLLTRSASRETAGKNKRWLQWTPGWESAVEGVDGVINLAGEPIAGKRWNAQQKRRILTSRVETTQSLVNAIASARQKPNFLINGSAIGYYGAHGDERITETEPPGSDFLATTCQRWEEEAKKAAPYGVRVSLLRTGIVLGRNGGALAKMTMPFKFFVGGPLGSGNQWMSWIHLEDEIGLILFLIDHALEGPYNATAPTPERNKDFSRTLAEVMGRPSWLPAPALAMRAALGEMASMLLTGQRVVPAAAEKRGYRFHYANLRDALQACMPL